MKIFLPFTIRGIGGTATFAAKFQAGMEAHGHTVSFDFHEDYDVLFLIVQCPLRYLIHAKQRGRPIVQRLDGVYYWTVSGWKFPLMNAKATYIRHLFADLTIYQSAYSRHSAEHFLGSKAREHSVMIYNGVDTSCFTPDGPQQTLRDQTDQAVFFTASAFRREDQIMPLLAAFAQYQQEVGHTAKLVVAGSFTGPVAHVPSRYRNYSGVHFVGTVKNADLPAYERAADAFLFTHLNPPCPNNVIEAMACGLPICGIADGAMAELVESGGNGLLLPMSGDAFWRRRTIDVPAFVRQMHEVVEQRRTFGQASRSIAQERFSLAAMTRNYSDALEHLL